MTSPLRKGIALAVLHVAIVASLGAKLLVDRSTCTRVWVRTAPVDPNLPIRGRYVRLRVEVARGAGLEFPVPEPVNLPSGQTWTPPLSPVPVTLAVENGALTALPAKEGDLTVTEVAAGNRRLVVLAEPLAFFIPERVADPSQRPAGEELWVEVTIPRRGPPRPIQLGVKRDGPITPLDIR